MKKYLYFLFILPALALLVSACDSTTTGPDTVGDKGSIYVQSTPAGAQIWIDGSNASRTTPDSVTNLSAGSHQVTLKLSGYRDTTISVNVTAGFQAARSVNLTADLSVTGFGTVKIWETIGTTASQPSGLDLSAGTAVSVNDANADIYYSSNGFVVRTSTSRNTVFYISTSSNLNDGNDSPLAQNSGQGGWTDRMTDVQSNYVFLYDQDGHYSKLKIVNTHLGSGTGDPSWVEVQWLYNNKVNDTRF